MLDQLSSATNQTSALYLALFLAGFLLGCLITASLASPGIGRAVSKVLSVVLLGVGVGFLVWATLAVTRGESLRPPFGMDVITEPSEVFGWGGGFLAGGVLTLVLAFVGRRAPQTSQPGRTI
jgi:hypothetical protein